MAEIGGAFCLDVGSLALERTECQSGNQSSPES